MAVYFVTGKLGSGKTLITVGKVKDYLSSGRRVATNLDLYSEHLTSKGSKASFIRLPDKPRPKDLIDLGMGSDEVDESTYGLIVLDECGTWLNSRTWNDKERKEFVDWLLHARKYGWDIMFIIQSIEIVDKQIKLTLCEHLVECRRLDRLQVPFLSAITRNLFGFKMNLPKIHRAKVYYGETAQALVADVWTYRGKDLYHAYDTRQVFAEDNHYKDDGSSDDMRASYSVLSRWHVVDRYGTIKKQKYSNLTLFIMALTFPVFPVLVVLLFIAPSVFRSRRNTPIKDLY